MIVLLLEVFKGPVAALPAAIFLGIIIVMLYNFWVISLGGLVCVCPIGPIGPVFDFCSLGFLFCLYSWSWFCSYSIDVFKFLFRKKGWLSFI